MSQSTSVLLLGGTKAEASRLRRALSRHFLLVETAPGIAEAGQLAERCRFDALVLVDPEPPWKRMGEILDNHAALPPEVLIITERERAEIAIDAMRDGACDALLRPVSNDELVAALIRAVDDRDSRRRRLRQSPRVLVEESPAIRELRLRVQSIAPPPVGENMHPGYPLDWTLEQVKRLHMIRVLEASGGNKTVAARRLNISRKTLERKLLTRSPDRRRIN